MNFNWANELAKNALKTAQKRIDSVLDIAPEDEVEGDEEFNALIASPVEGSEEQGKKLLEQHDGWTESNDSFYAAYDMAAMGQSGVGNAGLGKDTNPTEWISQWSSQGDEVVDSEPNPIRDSHHSGLLQHSPDSNSPEELVCNGEEQDDCHSNDASKSKEATEQLPNLQLNALDVSKHSVIDAISRKNDQQHDETLTLVSSDFEVLRQSDSCSIASSITPKSLPALTPGTSTADLHQQVPETTEKISNSANKQSVNSEIAHLKTQIQYQERRIRDLQLQNQRLEAKTKELLALKVVRTQQSSAEVRIMKKLSEKEMELADLLQEGEKLAKTNGKLMNELKKLRASLSEYEQLAKKSAQAEIDRDLAREEVRGLMRETTKLRNTINSLEAELGELKIANEGLMIDLKKRDDKIGRLLVNIQESEASRELAYEELRQMESVVAEISSKVEQREMTTKNVEEITRGLSADLEEEKRKNDQQANYIDSLEKRLSEMMETQRNNAEMVAVATAPLLESIQRLEEEISVKDNECKQIVYGKEAVIGTLKAEKERLTRENTEISTENNQLQQRIQENDIVVTRLTERIQQLELQNKRLESNSIKLSHEVEELTKSLIEKEDEIERVYIRLREKTDMLEMRIKQKQNEVDVARKHSEALEDELRKVLTHSNESLIQQQRLGKRVNFMPNNQMQHTSSMGLPNFAIQAELADAHSKYEQSMRQISALEQKISSMEAESRHLSVLRNELQALKSLYGNLLEAHGEKIERIEELEMDLADMKKLMKDQVEYFLAKNE